MEEQRYVVRESDTASTPTPIVAYKGRRLVYERRQTGFPDWIWVVKDDDQEGWVPSKCLEAL